MIVIEDFVYTKGFTTMYGKETQTLYGQNTQVPEWRSNYDLSPLLTGEHILVLGQVQIHIEITESILNIKAHEVRENEDLVQVPPLSSSPDDTLKDLKSELNMSSIPIYNDTLSNDQEVIIVYSDIFKIPINQPLTRLVLLWRDFSEASQI